nr:damage-control phosphatase ARMT1-like [Danaus plexippus plexippus]
MSKVSVKSPPTSKSSLEKSATSLNENDDPSTTPDFIYGGPFIKVQRPEFMDITTPINVQLQGTYKRSFAYHSLKERFPVILTKIIDYLSREGGKVKSANNASDEDIRNLIEYVVKLKNDVATNKKYDLLTVDTPEAKKWNEWILSVDSPYYFTNTWVFSECYVYRRLREGCELTKGLANFDPFEDQKIKSFTGSLEPMCVVAEKVISMMDPSDKDKRKADFITLLKLCLWSNKCDLSLSMGEQVTLGNKDIDASPSQTLIDPIQMIVDYKDKVLVDDSNKISDQVFTKAENIAKAIEANTTFKAKCSCQRLAGAPPPPVHKHTYSIENCSCVPDIVCDNSGYELFTDLCLADFLISQNIVKRVRFHVKKIPWFVSDVTPKDFNFVINQCCAATFNKVVKLPAEGDRAEGESEAPPTRTVADEALKTLGSRWAKYVDSGAFVVMCDDFWTSPHVYKDMKKYEPNLYRKLQFAAAILFKGDLNYRKLLGERNCNPCIGFEPALQGFIPAPIIAVRTVKADLICGLPKGKWEQLTRIDDRWMETGNYGVIQFCAKAEALKVSDKPCEQYGDTCKDDACLDLDIV